LSNGKGIINTNGVLLLNLKNEGYYYNGVSFYESFEKFKSTNLKIRPEGMAETLKFATITSTYSGFTAPAILTSYVDPGAIINFKNGNFLNV